mgnify:CR=1 FL=1
MIPGCLFRSWYHRIHLLTGRTNETMIDIDRFMVELAAQRPLFHSEADFQHDFAWAFHQQFPGFSVRLEYPVHVEQDNIMYLDLWLYAPGEGLAIELKYKTRFLEIDHNGEHFRLKDHSAQDEGRYDFLKDVMRLEQIKRMKPHVEGYAVLLTNEPLYWKSGQSGTNDEAFHLQEGRQLTGELSWNLKASKGTTKGRLDPILLRGSYTVTWKAFSNLQTQNSEFRYLALKI